MSVHRLESGSTGKYQHSVSGVPSTSCCYFPVLPSSRLGTDSEHAVVLKDMSNVTIVQHNSIQYTL